MKKSAIRSLIVLLLLVGQLLWSWQSGYALTIGEERDIGEQLLYSVRKEMPLLDEPDISAYINQLGTSVLQVIGPQNFDYRFYVVKSDQFNAFAAPGGLVFFYSGLIQTVKTEDELVSVLAHEIGHVVSRHIAQRLDKTQGLSYTALAGALAGALLGVPALMVGSMAAAQSLSLKYSRLDEEQADRLSFEYMQKLRRNPKSLESMLKSMRRISRYSMGSDTPQYLLTHPNPDARLDYVQSLLKLDPHRAEADYYNKSEGFAFLRFKYRVLSQALETDKLKTYCVSVQNLPSSSKLEQVMSLYGLALVAAGENRYDEALAKLQQVHKALPDEPILEIDRATLLLQLNRLDEAAPLLEQAYAHDPTDMYAVFYLAKLNQMRGNSKKAEMLLHLAEKGLPEYPPVFFELARIESDRNHDGMSLFYLGKYNLYQGQVQLARKSLKRAIQDKSTSPYARNEARNILKRLKELKEGVK